jgi:nucleotide-binding universal stress UspA family protein
MTTDTADHIRQILVPTDFSENADTALDWAIQVAAAHGATLMLLHVADVPSMGNLPVAIQDVITGRFANLQTRAREAGVEADSMLHAGRPWEHIVAEAIAFDLVVMGARGQTPLAIHPFGVGSTADRVLRASPAPTLTVHGGDAMGPSLPHRIIVPTDFSESATLTLETVISLFGPSVQERLEITLLHAWLPLVEYECAFASASIPPLEGTEEQARSLLEAQASKVGRASVDVTPVLRSGYPYKVIREEAEAKKAHLVALGTHGRSGLMRLMLGSVAERVIHHATCPVLSVCPHVASPHRAEDALERSAT